MGFVWRVLVFSLLVLPALANDAISNAKRFEETYRSARTLRVVFLEEYSENGKIVRREAGTALFRRPGRMRWEYEKPENNLFLVDGKTAWFYTPADHTATRVPARQSEDWRTPLALLAGEMKLSRVCSKVAVARALVSEVPDHVVLECQLKGTDAHDPAEAQDTPPDVFFEIAKNGQLARLLVKSSGGIQTDFHFKNWEINPALPEALFQFSPPPGVVIVNGLLPSSPSVRQ
jgi:outer membrane lipoprotein carrier protein